MLDFNTARTQERRDSDLGRIDVAALKSDLAARAADIACSMLGPANKRLSSRKELRWNNQGSLVLSLRGRRIGRWKSFEESDTGGDMIDLIRWYHRVDFVEACQIAADLLHTAPRTYGVFEAGDDADDDEDKRNLEEAHGFFADAISLGGTLAEVYLREHRKIAEWPATDDLRFHGRCRCGLFVGPCLLALTRDIQTNMPRGIIRIALNSNGSKFDRMALGPTGGTAVKLWDDAAIAAAGGVIVAEGLETALSMPLIPTENGAPLRPVWSLTSASGIGGFKVLPNISTLGIAVDADEAGRREAEKCKVRWYAAGKCVKRFTPYGPEINDFNDLLQFRSATNG